MSPSKLPYSSGWSSVCTARWLTLGSVGTPFGTAQRHQHAVVLEPEVVVQSPGVVLLDDEASCPRGEARVARGHRLGSLVGVPHRAVRGESVLRPSLLDAGLRSTTLAADCARPRGCARPTPSPSTDAPPAADSAASGSPIVRSRSSTSSYSSCRSPGLEFVPGARCRHRRVRSPAQRVRRDGGLGAVVLAPVQQHPALAQRLLHVADHQFRTHRPPGIGRVPGAQPDASSEVIAPSIAAYR